MTSTVIIAGCGYLGAELGSLLARQGQEVWGLRRDPTLLPPEIQPLAGDLTDAATLRALPPSRYLVYAAAPDESSELGYQRAYVTGLQNVLAAWSGSGQRESRLILVSSTAVYAQQGGQWVDESAETRPNDFNGQVLLQAESALRTLTCCSIALRLGGIYGPGRNGLLRCLREGRAVLPPAGQYTNRIHVTDAARMIAHLLQVPDPAPVYNGVDDDPADQNEVLTWLSERTGIGLGASGAARARGSNKRCRNALIKATGFELRYPSFRDGYSALLG